MEKKQNKKELSFINRVDGYSNKNLSTMDSNKDENLIKYNDLKEQLKYNLKDDIENKIKRMQILYEIKDKELYRYDNFKSFDEFIKSYVIAKSQAYRYLRIYKKVLEGAVSIDKIKEVGFRGVLRYIEGGDSFDSELKNEKQKSKKDVPIRILVKDEEVYDFCKEDTKRLYFIIEYIYKNKKDVLMEGISQYERYRKEKKKK